jgi:DNA-binding transcriptional LysR family regulator
LPARLRPPRRLRLSIVREDDCGSIFRSDENQKGKMNIVSRIPGAACESILDKIDLKQLRYFMAVADAGSFSRAAERLNVAQSHLSRQVMRIEAALGHRLFVRKPRHVELTDAGIVLRKETQFISIKLDSLSKQMNDARHGSIGSLCLGLTNAECFHALPAKIVQAVARQHPRLSLSFCVEPRASLIEAIIDRRIQACFAPTPSVASAEIRIDQLATEPLLLAVHKHHRLAGRDPIELSDVADEPLILCERNSGPETYDQIIGACERIGFSPRLLVHAPQPACALLLASAGVGATFVPASIRPLHGEELHFASLAGDVLQESLALISRADEHVAGVSLLRKHALAVATAGQFGQDHSARLVPERP